MALTSLEIKDKSFNTKFRGYSVEEVDEFLDIVVRDYEDLVRENHNKDARIKNLEERLTYFDEMKEATLSVGGITFGISGSGPSVFALAESHAVAERILAELHKIYAGQGIETLSFIEDLANGKGCRLSQFDE